MRAARRDFATRDDRHAIFRRRRAAFRSLLLVIAPHRPMPLAPIVILRLITIPLPAWANNSFSHFHAGESLLTFFLPHGPLVETSAKQAKKYHYAHAAAADISSSMTMFAGFISPRAASTRHITAGRAQGRLYQALMPPKRRSHITRQHK